MNPDISINSLSINIATNQQPGQQIVTTKSSYTNFWPGYRRLYEDSPENVSDVEVVSSKVPDTEVSPENLSDLEFVSSPVPDTEVSPENLSDLDVEVVTYRVSETEDSPENVSDVEVVSLPVSETEDISV